MFARDQQPRERAEAAAGARPVAAARAVLAAIDAKVFADIRPVPFYEQSVLIRRAVIRLLGDG